VNDTVIKLRRGAVLVWALVLVTLTTLTVGGVSAYYTSVGRLAKAYRDGTERRFAGQLVIDTQMTSVLAETATELNKALEATPAVVDFSKLAETLKDALKAQGFKPDAAGGAYRKTDAKTGAVLTVESPDKLTDAGQTGSRRTLRVVYFGGGITLHQEITFEKREESTTTEVTSSSHPSFDYVYFVNNYGHLDSSSIIANGNVHANATFSIADATVNGFVTAYSNTITIVDGVMWPERTYQNYVSEKYGKYRPQVRPIDGNPVEWFGGYLPPLVVSSYKDDYTLVEPYPTVTEPTWPGPIPRFEPTQPKLSDYQPTELQRRTYTTGKIIKVTHYVWYYTYQGNLKEFDGIDSNIQKWKAEDARDDDMRDAQTRYTKACTDYLSLSNYYATVTLAPWNEYYAEMEKVRTHTTDAELGWKERSEKYARERQNWNDSFEGGTLVTPLKDAMTMSGEPVVNDKAGYVEMLNLSDTGKYQNYCAEKKGKLYCKNCYKDENGVTKRMVWRNAGQLDIALMMLRKYEINKGEARWKDWWIDDSNLAMFSLNSNPWSQASEHPFTRELSDVTVENGYAGEIYPFANYAQPCTYSASFSRSRLSVGDKSGSATVDYGSIPDGVKAIERGSVILIGSYDYPIVINGPVYFDGDVVIRGFVTGQGAIYSGRNIHIIGDIVYRPPSSGSERSYRGDPLYGPPGWPYGESGMRGTSKDELVMSNEKCDLLLLAARGNVIVGDYSTDEWRSQANMQWLKCPNGTASVGNTYEDSDIGYRSGHSDYTALDKKGRKVELMRMTTPYAKPLYYKSYGSSPILYAWEDQIWYYGETVFATNDYNRAFYQCSLGDMVIRDMKQSGDSDDLSSISPVDYVSSGTSADGFIVPSASRVKATSKANKDAADITQIDAVLFAGHGIFGVVGGSTSHTFTLNGAMICRDEGLFPSFDARFKNVTGAKPKIWLNWDMRIKSDTDGGNPMVAVTPETSAATVRTTQFDIYVSDWQQL